MSGPTGIEKKQVILHLALSRCMRWVLAPLMDIGATESAALERGVFGESPWPWHPGRWRLQRRVVGVKSGELLARKRY